MQPAAFCRELSPTRTEHLMNRAREELNKLEKKSKKLIEKKRSSPEQEQSKSKAKVDVSSLVKAKKNEMCVSEENGLEISKMKEKKKKHKSKSRDYTCENNELNNTLSLGLRVNIELANGTNENDIAVNPKNIKTILMKHGSQDSTLRLKEKTEKTKSDENKKQKGVKPCQKLGCKECCKEIVGNEENLEKSKIGLTLSATMVKADKRKKLKTVNEIEETVCTTKHRKKKSRGELSPLEKNIFPEKIESSQNKRHKKDKNCDSTFHLEERKKKTHKGVLANSLLEIETEPKSKRKKKKHKDISESIDKDSEERKHKSCKKDEEESSYVGSYGTIKKTKKKNTIEHTESLNDSHNEVYCNESVSVRKDKKHKKSRDIEKVHESLTLDSSEMYRTKKKKHKDAKESGTSFTEASYGDNTEETDITGTESSSRSPNKRKRTKHKTDAFELEVQDAEVCSNKKKKEKVAEISNGCIMDKPRKNKHRENGEEFVELIGLQKKSKRRKSTEEEVTHDISELTESKSQKESKRMKEDEFTCLHSKSTKHKKKRDKECKDVENTDYSSENIQEINANESASFEGQGKKVKRKRRSKNENAETQNVLLEGEHQIENMPDVDSSAIDRSSEQMARLGEESIVAASDRESGQIKKKTKKSKSTERERAEINSEVTLPETDGENSLQSVSPLGTPLASKANKTFGRSPMERLLYGDPNSMVTETCTHCSQCSHSVTAKPSPSVTPVVNSVNVKREVSVTPKLQDVDKPCIVEDIVDTIVIKKEPGLETENSNSEVIEPINFIDVNNIKIKQEPGLETETPSDQVSDPIQLNLSKNNEQQKEIKKEPGTETQNNLNAAVSSTDMLAPLEAEQQLTDLKKEHVVEQPNISTDGASAVEGRSDTPTKDTYLNSVISAEDGASEFFRHAPKSTDNTTASEHQSECVGKTTGQTETPTTSTDIPKAKTANNVPDNAERVASRQQRDLSKHKSTSREASSKSEKSLVQRRHPALKEEWIYELHMVDVPNKVHFRDIAYYFRVPLSKIKEYPGYGRRPGFKHVVVSLSHYTTCLRMSKKRRLFGSRHTFIWSFKKYIPRDS